MSSPAGTPSCRRPALSRAGSLLGSVTGRDTDSLSVNSVTSAASLQKRRTMGANDVGVTDEDEGTDDEPVVDVEETVKRHCQFVLSRNYLLKDPFASDIERMEWALRAAMRYRGLAQLEGGKNVFSETLEKNVCMYVLPLETNDLKLKLLQLRGYTTGVRSHLVGKARSILKSRSFLDNKAGNNPDKEAQLIANLLESKRFFCADVQHISATNTYKVGCVLCVIFGNGWLTLLIQRKGLYEGPIIVRFMGELLFSGNRSYYVKLDLPGPSEVLLAWSVSLLEGLLQEKLDEYRDLQRTLRQRIRPNFEGRHHQPLYDVHFNSIRNKTQAQGQGWLEKLWQKLVTFSKRGQRQLEGPDAQTLYVSDDDDDDTTPDAPRLDGNMPNQRPVREEEGRIGETESEEEMQNWTAR
jgi:hypothetical protein